jgi:signal transduction histidine kinase/CheY-like chemotaxis protein
MKVPALVAVVRASDLVYEFANEAYCTACMFDAPPVGVPFGRDQTGRTDRDLRPLIQRVARTGEAYEAREVPVRIGPEKRETFFDLSYQPIRDAGGTVDAVLLFAADVTASVGARHEAEAHARMEEQMLRAQKLESLGLLASGVAHDFNNLLTGILGNASMARASAEGRAREALDDAIAAAKRASMLTRQLLAYAGKAKSDVRALDLSANVGEIAQLLAASLPKRVQLRLELPRGAEAPVGLIEADAAQLQQVVMNLVINAAEAIEEAGTVTVRTRGEGDRAILEVTDTGAGMDETTRARIFDPFFSTKGPGRGLGLSAIQGIVRAHGGSITIASQPGRGTTFTLSFPVTNRAPSRPRVADADADAKREAPRSGRGAVLVVDDEPWVRKAARRALEDAGFVVIEADSGRAALAAFERAKGDVVAVLLDVTMPDLSGGEALRELRARGATAPVILSSGLGDAEHEAQPGLSFLAKPYTSEELVTAVRQALGPSATKLVDPGLPCTG